MALVLNKLRVLRNGKPVYSEKFHEGVSIIRGKNGSGKSTIADFIFYILGGDFSEWKDAAQLCDEVQAEITTYKGKLTLRREIDNGQTPIWIYFGKLKKAKKQGLDGWTKYPIKRQESNDSFSQILFRALGIPEAKGEGASNITMHQLLRLLYSDQRTPAYRLFRFDAWDNQNTREAVGDLLCGIQSYENYEIELKLRSLEKELGKLNSSLNSLLKALPSNMALRTKELINLEISNLKTKRKSLLKEIANVDSIVELEETKAFMKGRKKSLQVLRKLSTKIVTLDNKLETANIDSLDIEKFLDYLNQIHQKISFVDNTASIIGDIAFTHCPACQIELSQHPEVGKCVVCGSPTDIEAETSKYHQIQLDIELQIRESEQLLDQKQTEIKKDSAAFRETVRNHESLQSEYSLKYDLSSSPRESYLSERNFEVGQTESEIEHLAQSLNIAEEIADLSEKKASIQGEIQNLIDRQTAVTNSISKRRKETLSLISDTATELLHRDTDSQPEFVKSKSVALDFKDDRISVDGSANFAESSNVFLKNSAVLSLILSAHSDSHFYHPNFVLFDNIEDKGMEPERSHRFQELIVEYVTEIESQHQVIFTTSMMNPKLELDDYTIGPHYTPKRRTLDFDDAS